MQSTRLPRVAVVWALLSAATASAIEPRAVSFPAADGFTIHADYYAAPSKAHAPMVILLHMNRADRTSWKPLIGPLHDAGMSVLAIDLRGHGQSATSATRKQVEQRDTALYQNMQLDVRGAYDWLVQQPDVDRSRFALVGASVGCSVALAYAAKDRSVDVVVCLSPGLDYLGLDSVGDIQQVTGRQIVLLATADERAAPEKLAKLTPGAVAQIQPGAAHGTDMFGKVSSIEERIVHAVRQGVGGPPDRAVYGTINSNIYHEADSGWLAEIAPTNLRVYSSAQEAEARGLRAARSKGPDDRGDKPGRQSGRDEKPKKKDRP